jgi:hypothetical protein
LAHILATKTPIRVLAQKSNGWQDLSAMVKTYHTRVREEAIRFDGKSYRLDPKDPVPLRENTPGEVLIPSLEGATYLFR